MVLTSIFTDAKTGAETSSDDSFDDDSEDDKDDETSQHAAMVQLSLSKSSASALGAWEQHTKVLFFFFLCCFKIKLIWRIAY